MSAPGDGVGIGSAFLATVMEIESRRLQSEFPVPVTAGDSVTVIAGPGLGVTQVTGPQTSGRPSFGSLSTPHQKRDRGARIGAHVTGYISAIATGAEGFSIVPTGWAAVKSTHQWGLRGTARVWRVGQQDTLYPCQALVDRKRLVPRAAGDDGAAYH